MEHNHWIRKAVLRIKNMRFQNKLMLGYLLICVIPLIVVSVIIFRQSAVELEESSQEFAALYTSQIRTSLNEFMKEYDKVTKSVLIDGELIYKLGDERNRSMDELILQRVAVQRLLMRVALLKPEIGTVMLVSRDNAVYQYTTTTNVVNENALLSQNWFKRLRSSDETFFITGLHDRSYYDDQGEGAMVTVGRVLLNSDGAYAGILLIDLDPFALLQLDQDFVSARDKYGMSVTISNRHGEIVYQSDAASGRLSWQQVLESGGGAYIKVKGGKNRIILTGNTELGKLLVRTEIPREKLLAKINQIQGVTLIVILASCLIIALMSFGLSYTITRPIKALRKSMKQAEIGQYLPIEKKQANDEIGSLVNSYNKMIVTIRTLIEDVYIAEIKHRRAKFIALQNQINPHMLYNTLESIRMKALVNDDEETAGMIKILARMFRLALGKEGRQHSVKHELEYTANYVQLQNLRFDHKFLLDIRIPEDIQQCSIIPLVFQPIVENSINHGFEDYSQTMNIAIEGFWTEEGEILIRMTDDGIGMTEDKQKELQVLLEAAGSDKYKLDMTDEPAGKGLGLKNIAERIKLHYGDRYYLMIRSGIGQGTTVEILIPKI
ncbi:histidine kinase [Paenibacillus macerans]|uniref:cache domain-containing sensor histidine kinase n=1 Tax=Paenibacillus macerans TaxID=44252 RepID=UPI000EBA6CF2|nr:sensor histidine kinase [Paenibacillus macerans]MEC0332764.1 histidine kinase [Paenibacillus macerans]GBK60218.1 sensor histidine kinase [Paenibacillus macerans]GBK66515.1 sensor histidine kinase [Paenibacillus macerans]